MKTFAAIHSLVLRLILFSFVFNQKTWNESHNDLLTVLPSCCSGFWGLLSTRLDNYTQHTTWYIEKDVFAEYNVFSLEWK